MVKKIHFSKHEGIVSSKKNRTKLSLVMSFISFTMLLAGMYLISLSFAPVFKSGIFFLGKPLDIAKGQPVIGKDMIYIPKISVSVPLLTGGEEVMENGAWHRFPERGDPITGGNFIVSAHRFVMKWTPGATANSSPFYNIGKLNEGDEILVDYKAKRYKYQITKKYSVKPDAVSIEDPVSNRLSNHKMTLYSCTLRGSGDGREVFEAKLIGQVKVEL
jgi:LPXTG-site transpeptidase (sortase) family protein